MAASCRNPECVRGLTPGVVIKGKGNEKMPILGQTMYWAWVRCLACNPPEDSAKAGAQFKLVQRTEDEMARRAELATQKSPYKDSDVGNNLGKLKGAAGNGAAAPARPTPVAANAEQTAQLTKLLATVEKLTGQVSELLDENRTLRKKIDELMAGADPPPPPPKPRKPRAPKPASPAENSKIPPEMQP